MFSQITIDLKNDHDYGFEISSLLHGFLMENISNEYAKELHQEGTKNYSQHIEKEDGNLKWIVSALTDEGYEQIIKPLKQIEEVELTYKDDVLQVKGMQLRTRDYENILKETYFGNCPRKIRMEFVSPAAFKVNGAYQFFPTTEHIMKSLISRHDAIDSGIEVYSEEFMEQIQQDVHITGYRLRSVRFPLEGVSIPAFMGSVTLTIGGSQQFVNLINMLCMIGEYTGVGIKTGIGMGSIHVGQIFKRKQSGK